jgi:hypothetical protein
MSIDFSSLVMSDADLEKESEARDGAACAACSPRPNKHSPVRNRCKQHGFKQLCRGLLRGEARVAVMKNVRFAEGERARGVAVRLHVVAQPCIARTRKFF